MTAPIFFSPFHGLECVIHDPTMLLELVEREWH